jgi:hypothetical protein
MSVTIPPGSYRLTAKAIPVAAGHFFGWNCIECSKSIAVFDDHQKGVSFDTTAFSHAVIKCPHCAADRMYAFTDMKKIHVKSPLER